MVGNGTKTRKPASRIRGPRRVVALAYPQLVLLDLVGPAEIFSSANRIVRAKRPHDPDPYAIEVVSVGRDLRIETASKVRLLADCRLSDCKGKIDTLLIPGVIALDFTVKNAAAMRWLHRNAPHIRRVASICSGAFVLAACGFLNGRRATTHWEMADRLAREYPEVRVQPDSIYVKDGNVYTSAGVTAGMDLALALVEEDLGRDVALNVARALVMFVRRPGGQSQFSALLESQIADRDPLRELQVWAVEHPRADLSVEGMASRVRMSPRNFSRVFGREVGKTPARFAERLRVDAACRRFEETAATLDQIAGECGFGSANSMRRAFLRTLCVAPSDYRGRFRR
jgi:transcriptional regulator GlxA family with amidase domain